MITIFIPQQLRSYTAGATTASAKGATVDAAFNDLDARFPGIRFRVIDEQGRIREHMRVFVDGERVRTIDVEVAARCEVHIFGALSGG
jgi:molybdopterin converting factor small subunit